ncbi:hypothetical protein NX059_010079 [Plenodomus lindquistii]|nr:hypothetical protein NX059_010079 [Plenodomus lindquistii]
MAKKGKQPIAATAATSVSITRNYTGVSAYREMEEHYVTSLAESNARMKAIKRMQDTVSDNIGSNAGNLIAATDLFKAAREVNADVKELANELNMIQLSVTKLEQVFAEIRNGNSIYSGLDERSAQLLTFIEMLWGAYADLLADNGDAAVIEESLLRQTNAALQNTVDVLTAREETLRGLLVTTYQTSAPAASSIEGIELPDWFLRDSDDPFKVIENALDKNNAVNKELQKKCVELQAKVEFTTGALGDVKDEKDKLVAAKTEVEKQLAAEQAKAEQAAVQRETNHQVAEALETLSSTAVESEIIKLNQLLQREQDNVTEARRVNEEAAKNYASAQERERKHVEDIRNQTAKQARTIGKLQSQNGQLSKANALLMLQLANNKVNTMTIQEVRDEAEKRVQDQRNREETLIKSIQDAADERVKRAEQAKKAAEDRLAELEAVHLQNVATQQSSAQQQLLINEQNANLIIQQKNQKIEELQGTTQAAEKRAQEAEDAKQEAQRTLKHLQDTQASIIVQKNDALRQKNDSEKSLEGAQEQIKLLQEQAEERDGMIRDLREKDVDWKNKEMEWKDDIAFGEELLERLQKSRNKCIELNGLLLKYKEQNDEMRTMIESGLVDTEDDGDIVDEADGSEE